MILQCYFLAIQGLGWGCGSLAALRLTTAASESTYDKLLGQGWELFSDLRAASVCLGKSLNASLSSQIKSENWTKLFSESL